ncbi:protease modulator HflK [Trinickia fusca]|uniref:Protease modulator HflK n=1 Tax=Trinickia fusca TaxID=2419777 RepID=A0A494X084_9BURK|nr:protease modulator HflK [Trinickia fusca]RKP44178.1 protease modulator HflK [Trinickia fusca]
MSYLAGRESDDVRPESVGLAWIGSIAAGLAAAFAFLSAVPGLPVDVRWYAPLASAWLDLFIVANSARLVLRGPARPARQRNWRMLVRTLWHSMRRRRSGAIVLVVMRVIPWEPWGIVTCALASVAATASVWQPIAPATLIRAMVSPVPLASNAVVLLTLAFLTLIAERYHDAKADRSAAAASLARLLRVVLLTTLVAAASAAWLLYAGTTPDWLLHASALFSGAIAVELAVRAALLWFAPPARRTGATRVASSAIASIVRWQPSPITALGDALRTQYGIDLRQNWVLQTVVRLLPMAVAAVVVGGWLLTSVSILGPNERAVYERFGKPVAVWQSGPHVGLPWPFGKARPVDNGAVHQLIVSGNADNSSVTGPTVPADGSTPDQLNRLWDIAHPWETTQVIAGASGGQQNFQIVNADVRLDYRVGTADADARAALYRADDLEGMVRSIANREVVHYLASHTLESLLETRQTVMADAVRRAVQQRLDQLGAGVDVLAVVIESIHPPAGAAAAYHGVQAAQVRAQASVAKAQAYAAGELGDAQREALEDVGQAGGRAAETLARAQAQQIEFDADVGASRLGGPAFALEYYLRHLQNGLRHAQLTVIDDRLASGGRATLDLRSYPTGDLAGIQRNK